MLDIIVISAIVRADGVLLWSMLVLVVTNIMLKAVALGGTFLRCQRVKDNFFNLFWRLVGLAIWRARIVSG